MGCHQRVVVGTSVEIDAQPANCSILSELVGAKAEVPILGIGRSILPI
jgi:hypothetical protein